MSLTRQIFKRFCQLKVGNLGAFCKLLNVSYKRGEPDLVKSDTLCAIAGKSIEPNAAIARTNKMYITITAVPRRCVCINFFLDFSKKTLKFNTHGVEHKGYEKAYEYRSKYREHISEVFKYHADAVKRLVYGNYKHRKNEYTYIFCKITAFDSITPVFLIIHCACSQFFRP